MPYRGQVGSWLNTICKYKKIGIYNFNAKIIFSYKFNCLTFNDRKRSSLRVLRISQWVKTFLTKSIDIHN